MKEDKKTLGYPSQHKNDAKERSLIQYIFKIKTPKQVIVFKKI